MELVEVGLAEELLHHLAALVEQEGGGRQAHVVEAPGGLAAGIHRHLEGQRVVGGVVAHVVGRVVAHGDGDGLEALGGELVVGRHQLGHLGDAGGTGGGPEVHQHDLAAQRGQAAGLAVEGGEAHVRGGRLAAAADEGDEEERRQQARDSLVEHRFLTGKGRFAVRAILRALLLLVISCQAWALGLADLTDKDASGGLREALVQGASKAVGQLGTDGGFLNNPKVKIGLPATLAPVEGMLRTMGRGKDLDALVDTMNKAAEQAVPKAKVLLVDAVKKMSVDDAKKILSGGDDAATQYFKDKTSAQLAESFLPTVKATTDKLALADKYNKIASKAGSLGLGGDELKIENYVTRKALDGLFLMIAEEERAIRQNPLGAAGSLAKKAFGALGQ